MIDINELRLLVQDYKLAGSPVFVQAADMNEILDRLEAAEKERDWNVERLEDAIEELKALRAKIEVMEQQGPVGKFIQHPSHGMWEQDGYGDNPDAKPLYALPGAQSVPTALLVAVANLVAQMEIIIRVGFVDTPNDKDSCAAFCVAEGTWLELMSAVESLASALAAAPEAKP